MPIGLPLPPAPQWRDEVTEAMIAAKELQEADEKARFLNALERIADALERMAGPVKDIEYKKHE